MNRKARTKFLLLNMIRRAGTLPIGYVTLVGVEPTETLSLLNEMLRDGVIIVDELGYRAAEAVKEGPKTSGIGFEP